MQKTRIALALLVGALLLPPAEAQKTYRCGNTFQDRPCNAPAQPAKTTPPPTAAAPAQPTGGARATTEPQVQRSAAARQAQRHQDLCDSLNLQLEDVRSRERASGAAATTDLARQRRGIEDKLSANHC